MIIDLPNFALEVYLGQYEFSLKHHLTASDPQTLTIGELLAMGNESDRDAFMNLGLGYLTTWGTAPLRSAIAATYDSLGPEHILCFAGAEEAMFWAMQALVDRGDHAIVTVPNYQSMESVTIATGADVSGWPIWEGSGDSLRWTMDLDRLRSLLRPNTSLIAVNVPNNPTGYLPSAQQWQELVDLCDERNITLYSDEAYRGLELDDTTMLRQAADATRRGVSLNVMSKAYGLPGLRIGWIASKDVALLERLERAKHYTTICNAGPSEFLATIALRNQVAIRHRNKGIIADNLNALDALFASNRDLIEWYRPDGGCVSFPRYTGDDGVEAFCQSLVDERSAVLLPSSIFRSALVEVPADRFRIGAGRLHQHDGWAELDAHLAARRVGR
jgi:aspartate/methionine/tyrosine aminotransferase